MNYITQAEAPGEFFSITEVLQNKELTDRVGDIAEFILLELKKENKGDNLENYLTRLETYNLGATIIEDAFRYYTRNYGLMDRQELDGWEAIAEEYLEIRDTQERFEQI